MCAPALAAAQAYPTKTVRIIAPFAAGSTIDILGRLIAPKLFEALGQPVIVEDRPGAGGMIGLDLVAKSPPDGHTLVIGALGPLAMNPALYSKTPFDPVQDFAAVSLLNFGSPGVGTSPHLTGELFKLITKTDIVHIPYKGNAEAITDLIGGQLSVVFTGVPPVVPLAKAGKVHLLATTGKQRLTNLPDVPTIREAGVEGADVLIWYGVVAPAATPKDVIARLNREIVKVMGAPAMREKFSQQGVDPASSTPEEFAQLIREEVKRWAKVIRSAGIKLE
jgi:tripartite-type tricarboxylate transporter receptor subunit TctC